MTSAAARWLMIAGCTATLAVPAIQRSQGSEDGPFRRFVASWEEVRQQATTDGWLAANRSLLKAMDELESGLEEDSVLMRAVLPTASQALSVLGAGNEKVYLGRDDWLFLRPGIDYLTGPTFLDPAVLERRARSGQSWQDPPQPDPLKAILDFHRQLEARGIALLVMPVPTKAMIYPEKLRLGATVEPPLQNRSFRAFRAELEGHGIEVFDPAPALLAAKANGEEDVFLRTDSHWSPAGVEAVAAALSVHLRGMGAVAQRGDSEAPTTARHAIVVHRGAGDLERMLELPEDSPWPPPEQVRLRRVVGQPTVSKQSEILLLGDSFSNVFSLDHLGWGQGAGLAEQLAFELGEPIDRLAVDAGGAWSSRQRLTKERQRLTGKRLVIYQFAIRELAVGDWKMIELPRPLSPDPSPTHASLPPGRGAPPRAPRELAGENSPLSRVGVKRGWERGAGGRGAGREVFSLEGWVGEGTATGS